MATYQIAVPRVISGLILILGLIFGFFWINTAFELEGNLFFVLIGAGVMLLFVGIVIYTIITGKYPYKFVKVK
jgi:hypothetical protein